MYNIAILIPATSNKRYYNKLEDTDLYKYFFRSFFNTYNLNYKYTIYLGIDQNDIFYQNEFIKSKILQLISVMRNTEIKIVNIDKKLKGFVCKIWNKLYDFAIKDNNDYFCQCGSDIEFHDKDWVDASIYQLKNNKNIGVVGLTDQGRKNFNENDDLITQSFVSKKHYEIFNFYFPPEIDNWCIDNWIGDIYEKHNLKYIIPHRILNMGGPPRYNVPQNYKEQYNLAMIKYNKNIENYFTE
tara:strand:+ start:165 stop:887 length:723 start_codon:yes stop_codon:yes gene_type:complete